MQLDEQTVNPHGERVSPQDFQLLKVLGKGGYGKVNASMVRNKYSFVRLFSGFSSEKSIRQSSGRNLCDESFEKSDVRFSFQWDSTWTRLVFRIVRNAKDTAHTKAERNILECVKVRIKASIDSNWCFDFLSVSVYCGSDVCLPDRWKIIFNLRIFIRGWIVYAIRTWRHFSRYDGLVINLRLENFFSWRMFFLK